jgi:hypothetical protein
LTIATGHSDTKPLEQGLCVTSTASMQLPLRYRELPAHRVSTLALTSRWATI